MHDIERLSLKNLALALPRVTKSQAGVNLPSVLLYRQSSRRLLGRQHYGCASLRKSSSLVSQLRKANGVN
jgi:hypothetical protein